MVKEYGIHPVPKLPDSHVMLVFFFPDLPVGLHYLQPEKHIQLVCRIFLNQELILQQFSFPHLLCNPDLQIIFCYLKSLDSKPAKKKGTQHFHYNSDNFKNQIPPQLGTIYTKQSCKHVTLVCHVTRNLLFFDRWIN